MAGFGIDYDAEGVLIALGELEGRALDLTAIARDTALLIQADVDERFKSSPSTTTGGVVYGGADWPELTQGYLEQRPERASGQLLRDTGELLQSFTIGSRGNIFESDKNSVTFGTSLPKAQTLNPKRPMIFAHPELVDNVTTLWQGYVIGDFGG